MRLTPRLVIAAACMALCSCSTTELREQSQYDNSLDQGVWKTGYIEEIGGQRRQLNLEEKVDALALIIDYHAGLGEKVMIDTVQLTPGDDWKTFFENTRLLETKIDRRLCEKVRYQFVHRTREGLDTFKTEVRESCEQLQSDVTYIALGGVRRNAGGGALIGYCCYDSKGRYELYSMLINQQGIMENCQLQGYISGTPKATNSLHLFSLDRPD